MATAPALLPSSVEPADAARLHFVLRFAVGTTFAYTVCEYMGWQPSALAAVLSGILLANLPTAPPVKVGLVLVLVMYLSGWLAFALTMWLHEVPHILFGVIGLILFLAFSVLAQAKAQLPLTLLLICLAIIPVITLTHPDQAPRMREVLVRAMGMAVIVTWIMHAIWPKILIAPKPPPPGAVDVPIATAAIGTFIVLPVMLAYWLFGLTDAMPVLLQVVLLVAKMEEERSKATAGAKLMGNFLGGLVAILAYGLLSIAPTLVTFAVITFIISFGYGVRMSKGGIAASNAELAFNATMIVLGLFIWKDAASGTLAARLVQFVIGCSVAVGMMALLWPRVQKLSRRSAPNKADSQLPSMPE